MNALYNPNTFKSEPHKDKESNEMPPPTREVKDKEERSKNKIPNSRGLSTERRYRSRENYKHLSIYRNPISSKDRSRYLNKDKNTSKDGNLNKDRNRDSSRKSHISRENHTSKE